MLKPLVGRGRVDGDAAIMRPLPDSYRGIVVSSGIVPTYSDFDTYAMAASAIDTAIRSAVASGGSLDQLALLDNFCWCSSLDPEKLYDLKRAAKACYDYGTAFGTPFVSGKDSMWNDFKGYDDKGPVFISIPPTLLVTAFGVVSDVRRAISCDLKQPGDVLYVLGTTDAELAGSEYTLMLAEGGVTVSSTRVPGVDASKNKKLYNAFARASSKGLVASAISVSRGGLAVALMKSALGGKLGVEVSLGSLPGDAKGLTEKLFSESQGRILVSMSSHNEAAFKKLMQGVPCTKIGTISKKEEIKIAGGQSKSESFRANLSSLQSAYRSTFKDF